MFCSFLTFIQTTTIFPADGAECIYNGYDNIPLILSVTYTRVKPSSKCDKCIFVENKVKKCKVYFKIDYEWFLDYETDLTFNNTLLKVKEKEGVQKEEYGIPIEMVNCSVVVNDNKNKKDNGNWIFRFVYNDDLKKVVGKLDEEKAQNFQSTNVIAQYTQFLTQLNVKNNTFVTKEHFANGYMNFMSIEKILDKKTNVENIKIKNTFVDLADANDYEDLFKAMDFNDVVFLQSHDLLIDLNLTDDKSITIKKTFKSIRSDNQIKIKNIPQGVSFEKVDIAGKQKALLKEYEVELPKQIECLTNMLLKKTIKLNVQKNYFEFMIDFCAYTFDPIVCAKGEGVNKNINFLKKIYDLIYDMVQTYCHGDYMCGNTPLLSYTDINDVNLVKEWLVILQHYVLNHKSFTESQKNMFKNTWNAILKVSTDTCYHFQWEFGKRAQSEEFIHFLKNIDTFVVIMDDLEVYMDDADKVIKDDKVEMVKITESYDKGEVLKKQLEPHVDYFSAFYDAKHKKFEQIILYLGKRCGKIKEDEEKKKDDDEDKKDTETDKEKETEKDETGKKELKLSATTIAIIIISVIVAVGIIVGCVIYLYKKKKNTNELPREETVN